MSHVENVPSASIPVASYVAWYRAERKALIEDTTTLQQSLDTHPDQAHSEAALFDRGRLAGRGITLQAVAAFIMTNADIESGKLDPENFANPESTNDY